MAEAAHVAPFSGAWIETASGSPLPAYTPGRPLLGGVD